MKSEGGNTDLTVKTQGTGNKGREGNRADGSERLNNEQNQPVWLTCIIRAKHLF